MKRLRLTIYISIIPNAYIYHNYIVIITPTTLKDRPNGPVSTCYILYSRIIIEKYENLHIK